MPGLDRLKPMNTQDLLRCDLQNREWIDEHLEWLASEYKGWYIAVYNKGKIIIRGKTIPVLKRIMKDAMISPDEVTTRYFPDDDEQGAMIFGK